MVKAGSSKFVPWEPFKAAPSADSQGVCPDGPLPHLIPYKLPKNKCASESDPAETSKWVENLLVSTPERTTAFLVKNGSTSSSNTETSGCSKEDSSSEDPDAGKIDEEYRKKLEFLETELKIERKLNAELKNLMVATMSEDLTCQISSLTEDKVRLAQKMSTVSKQLSTDLARTENLNIEKDVYKSKYEAVSIRNEQLTRQKNETVRYLSIGQDLIKELLENRSPEVVEKAKLFAEYEISSLLERSPCDEKVVKKHALTSNITISCCKQCSGEIYLL
ncbi:hypothetical protein L596_018946 [Steinernema carpocapsae]|uniref:Uncharacterized protein n=1 Tax=Steinernema carpocapsae TaxID=34508 RepID=A0A4U5N6V9_STECR|nr:hypothetical protein L596_018946 [Steinernema carpocapsae]